MGRHQQVPSVCSNLSDGAEVSACLSLLQSRLFVLWSSKRIGGDLDVHAGFTSGNGTRIWPWNVIQRWYCGRYCCRASETNRRCGQLSVSSSRGKGKLLCIVAGNGCGHPRVQLVTLIPSYDRFKSVTCQLCIFPTSVPVSILSGKSSARMVLHRDRKSEFLPATGSTASSHLHAADSQPSRYEPRAVTGSGY